MKSKLLRKFAKKIDGHITIGNLTLFGDNAMHFGGHLYTKKYGFLCFRLPLPCGISDRILYGKDYKLYWRPLYFYISRNATPWAAVFMIGKKHSPRDWRLAKIRKHCFGWNYDSEDEHQHERLRMINRLV